MIESKTYTTQEIPTTLPDGDGDLKSCPNLLTEDELIKFLRISEVSKARNYHNVIVHLKRYCNLPCIHLCRQPLYPRQAILDWIEEITHKRK